jgi:hypothetical protein
MEALSLAILAVGLFFLILGLIPGSQIWQQSGLNG